MSRITVGEEFEGKVVNVGEFGSFVELTPPGDEGFVHHSRVPDNLMPLHAGDKLLVRVIEIRDEMRIVLTAMPKSKV